MRKGSGRVLESSVLKRLEKLFKSVYEAIPSGDTVSEASVLRDCVGSQFNERVVGNIVEILVATGAVSRKKGESGNVLSRGSEEIMTGDGASKGELNQIALSLPSWEQFGMSRELESIGLEYVTLCDAFSRLISQAEEELFVCSPFVDYEGLKPFIPRFVNALDKGVKIRLLTRITPKGHEGVRLRGLRRFAGDVGRRPPRGSLDIRSYHYSDRSGLLSGIHAKFIIADRDVCYVGSGEFRTYSYEKNLEVGVILRGRPAMDLAVLFDYLFKRSQPVALKEDV